ncbi:hypothetical protein EOPP23_15330 [Endozoicomonas sp. OPT23]|nr:hypothetical protein [Endozoicomonas sp. OPT23]
MAYEWQFSLCSPEMVSVERCNSMATATGFLSYSAMIEAYENLNTTALYSATEKQGSLFWRVLFAGSNSSKQKREQLWHWGQKLLEKSRRQNTLNIRLKSLQPDCSVTICSQIKEIHSYNHCHRMK